MHVNIDVVINYHLSFDSSYEIDFATNMRGVCYSSVTNAVNNHLLSGKLRDHN